MAILNGKNSTKSVAFPIEKADPSEVDSRVKCIHEKYDMADLGAILANGDEILGPKLPEGAKIVDATLKIDRSLGGTGLLDFGLKEYTNKAKVVVPEDQNALVNQANGAGQAVLKRADVTSLVGIGQDIGLGGAQIFVKVTAPSTVTDAVIEMFVFYMLES